MHAATVARAALATPLVLIFFVLAGMRHAFSVPVSPGANWMFRLALPDGAVAGLAVARTLMWAAVAPVLAATLALALVLEAWPAALMHSFTTAALAAFLTEACLLHFKKLPFTCTYFPDKLNLKLTGMAFCGAFLLYAYGSASLEWRLTPHPAQLLTAAALVAVAGWALQAWNRRWQRRSGERALFDDAAEPLVRTLINQDESLTG